MVFLFRWTTVKTKADAVQMPNALSARRKVLSQLTRAGLFRRCTLRAEEIRGIGYASVPISSSFVCCSVVFVGTDTCTEAFENML